MEIIGYIVVLLLALATGCGTLIDGTQENIPVTTIPPGATVIHEIREDDSQKKPQASKSLQQEKSATQTPATLSLERKQEYLLTITKEGYKTETIKIEQVINDAAVGNLLGLTALGTAIDTASGAQWDLAPNNIVVSLRPLTAEEQIEEAKKLKVTSIQKQLQSLQDLKDAKLLTENQYSVLRDITMHSVPPTVSQEDNIAVN